MKMKYNICKGKNIIKLNINDISNNYISCTISQSKNSKNNIKFYDNNELNIIKTITEDLYWYNEISDTIKISCIYNHLSNLNIIYYSDKAKNIELEITDISYKEISSKEINIISSLNIFIENMDNKFLTNKKKIHSLIKEELEKNKKINLNHFPLSEKTYDHNEINAMIDVLLSNKLTMGENVELFETEFAKYINSKYAIMVNSGSSANLLAMAVLSNFKYKKHFNNGDKIIVPTICWSTSVWPIIQMGLIPVFVDIDINTLNADINHIEELLKTDPKIKGMVAVHILGNTTNMEKLMKLKEKYDLIIMEDTCESLGSKYNDKYLGTFGECGTYSFYFSHHITTIEGGMVVTDDYEIYQLLKCLRAHGWSRGIDGYDNKNIDNRFCFINVGYNLRPMEIQAAMGLIQLKKLDEFNNNRIQNYERVVNLIKNSKSDKLTIFTKEENSNPAWFSLPFILNKKYNKSDYLNFLESNNISTRPIVTGNFARQPVFKSLNYNIDPKKFKNAEIIHEQGFFIGLPSTYMSDEKISYLVNILLN
jgi:CDP-6-deoxy-D-xylo-4-hexulose-3-dehydrase